MRPEETFLGQPIRSLQTMLRVIAEDRPEYLTVVPDGIYGPDTISAVSRFQRNHGIPVTGITNNETWEAIAAEYELSMIEQRGAEALQLTMNPGDLYCRGDTHANIYIAQAILAVMSEQSGSIPRPSLSGCLDDATQYALLSFQELCGLPATGQLNKCTWRLLALHYPNCARLHTKQNHR